MMNEIQKNFGITEEELDALDKLEDFVDEAVLRERIKDGDIDDEENYCSHEELMAMAGLTRADIDAAGDVRIG